MSPKLMTFLVLLTVAAGSAGARWALGGDGESGAPAHRLEAGASSATSSTLVPGDSPPTGGDSPSAAAEDQGAAATALPYVSEASFFAVIGFALGYASKKVLKLGLIVLALFFVGLQGLSMAEVVTIDWQRALDVTNDLILNLDENQDMAAFLKDRIPSAGGLALGYALGFRKG